MLRSPRTVRTRYLLPALMGLLAAGCSSPGGGVDEAGRIPLTLENVFTAGGGAGRAVLSPDGSTLAVSGPAEGGGGSGVHLVPVPATAEVAAAGGDASTFRVAGRAQTWSPDGGRLAFIAGGNLLVAGTEGPGRVVAEGVGGLRAPSWSPDGETLAYYSTASGFQDIWLGDAAGAAAPRQLTTGAAEAEDSRFSPMWSPDGRWIAYISNRADWWHDDVWLVAVASGEAHQVSTSLMASSSPVWSPDGSSLVLMGTAKDEYWYQDLAYLYRIDLDLAGTAPRVLREAPLDMQVYATDAIMRFDPFWSGDGARIYFPYQQRGAFDLWSVPASGGVATRVTNVGGSWSSLHATPDGGRAAFTRDAATEGREAWLLELDGGVPARLTDFSPDFEGLQRPAEISFRSFDGLYMQGFLYLPPAIRAARSAGSDPPACPALVQVHGGGTNSYTQGTNLVEQYLANEGFVVLAINYRGGSGFGREFQDLSVEDWLNDQSKDPGAAADWLRRQPYVNGRVGIYGGSYGGMQSMSAITRTPDKFDAAVPMRGIYSESLTLPHADRVGKIFAITGHGGTPEERPEIYAKSETLDRMDRITAPVLIMHGEFDVRAPFENFELAVERLEALGKEFESMTYPEGHGFRDPSNSIDMYSRLQAFFDKHLGGCQAGGTSLD
ncbi:prolyl oligopeptidase family serine peptidase [Candidatus Palauibacter sp.]|uniref:S9 family peptidase n=1 Tax=Candidatus Palauibacter sp. TaxID=3101350 RepID=UPI003B023D25